MTIRGGNSKNKNVASSSWLIENSNRFAEWKSLKDWNNPCLKDVQKLPINSKISLTKDNTITLNKCNAKEGVKHKKHISCAKSDICNNKVSDRTKMKSSANLTWSQRINHLDIDIDKNTDEDNKGWNEINFKTFKHKFGVDVKTSKMYHYSDI